MNNKIVNLIVFAAGAGIGVAASWQYFKKKYEKIADEEIESVKAVYVKKEAALLENTPVVQLGTVSIGDQEQPEYTTTSASVTQDIVEEYEAIIKNAGYNTSELINEGPYVIAPEEFGELDYTEITYAYYADGILADENDNIMEDVEEVIGFDSLTHFGEYEDDSVYVRNDRLGCDYEILLDERNYSDLIGKKPPVEETE